MLSLVDASFRTFRPSDVGTCRCVHPAAPFPCLFPRSLLHYFPLPPVFSCKRATYVYLDRLLLCGIIFWLVGHDPPCARPFMCSPHPVPHNTRGSVSIFSQNSSNSLRITSLARLRYLTSVESYPCMKIPEGRGSPSRSLSPLESTLVKVYQNKRLYLPLESTLTKNWGRGARRRLPRRRKPRATILFALRPWICV